MIDNFHCSVKHNNNQNVFSIINDANGILKNDQYLGYDICGFVPWRYAQLLMAAVMGTHDPAW